MADHCVFTVMFSMQASISALEEVRDLLVNCWETANTVMATGTAPSGGSGHSRFPGQLSTQSNVQIPGTIAMLMDMAVGASCDYYYGSQLHQESIHCSDGGPGGQKSSSPNSIPQSLEDPEVQESLMELVTGRHALAKSTHHPPTKVWSN
jgi:hypothetical protein